MRAHRLGRVPLLVDERDGHAGVDRGEALPGGDREHARESGVHEHGERVGLVAGAARVVRGPDGEDRGARREAGIHPPATSRPRSQVAERDLGPVYTGAESVLVFDLKELKFISSAGIRLKGKNTVRSRRSSTCTPAQANRFGSATNIAATKSKG